MKDLTFESLPEIIREQAQRIEILEKSLIELKVKQEQDEVMTIDEYCEYYVEAVQKETLTVLTNLSGFFKTLIYNLSEFEEPDRVK